MLSGKSILIVEDSALIAVDIESFLTELGAAHVSSLGCLGSGIPELQVVDLAIVDIRTAGDVTANLAVVLGQHMPPIVFLSTDPDATGVPETVDRFKIVQKPFTNVELCMAIKSLLG